MPIILQLPFRKMLYPIHSITYYSINKGGENMNTQKKKISTAVLALVIGLTIISQPIYAAGPGFFGSNFFSGFIDFISKQFNLNKTDVQTALKTYQAQRKVTITPKPSMSPEARQAAEKARLDKLVTQGKITGDQENAIIAILAKYPQDPNATPEQRETQMTSMQNELKTWAASQKLDLNSILPMFGFGKGRGGQRGEERGERMPKPSVTPTP